MFKGRLQFVDNQVDASSGSLKAKAVFDNKEGKLWPGAFVEVRFHVPSDPGTLRLPSTALVFDRNGTQVALVGDDQRVALKPVTLGRNLGKRGKAQRLRLGSVEGIGEGFLERRDLGKLGMLGKGRIRPQEIRNVAAEIARASPI